jgi:multidrug efflux pump subunit AcrA (membrane-fusion protein)
MRQRIFNVLGFLGIIVIAFLAFKAMTSKKAKTPDVKAFSTTKYASAIKAEYTDHTPVLEAYGRLRSMNSIEVFSEVGGKMTLASSRFKVGNSFSKGSVMLEIESDEAEINLLSLRSEFLNLLSGIMSDIKSDYPSEYGKWSGYLERYDLKKNIEELPQYSTSKEKYFLASRRVFQTFYNVKNAELRMEKHILRAPFEGIVTESMVEAGSLVRIGQKLGKLSGTGQFELELTFTSDNARLLIDGAAVEITSPDNDMQWQGKIARIARNIDPGTQSVKVFVYLSGQGLKEGMYLKANTNGLKIPESLELPRAALINNRFVYIANEGKLAKIEVEVVQIGDDIVYIKGVNPDTVIITEPLANAEIGMSIEPIFNNGKMGEQ